VKARVVRVVDGDTIELEGGAKVRYIGVDTPETVKPNTPVQCFGKDASAKNKSLVEGKEVELEKDVSETDRYGRLLRYVYVGEVFVNKYLVDEGFAYSSSYPPDVKYQEIFKEAQRAAQEAKKGLWNSCPVDPKKVVEAPSGVLGVSTTASPPLVAVTPAKSAEPTSTSGGSADGSATSVPSASASHSGCVIKGNISSSGKIYHLPGCGSYDKTTVSESQGERWFCSEQDAINAGWRKAKNC
jgi:micrococcal nuclease